MMRALIIKELRSLRPFLFLGVAMVLTELVDKLLMPFEAQPFSGALSTLPMALWICQLLLGFAIGSGLLVREIDDGTLGFLDGLPVTRGAVFVSKLMAAMLVLTVYPIGLLALQVGLHLGARESLDHAVHPLLVLVLFGMAMLLTAVSLTLGMLLGFMRYLAWLVLSLCGIGVMLLKEKAPALHAAINPVELVYLRYLGDQWQAPHATIWTQFGAAVVFAVLAFVLFKSSGAVLARVRKWQRTRRLLLVPAVVVMIVGAIAGAGMVAKEQGIAQGPAESLQDGEIAFTQAAAGHATTVHYSFSYPSVAGERLRPFIKEADRSFEAAAAALKADGGPSIDVDLSGTTTNHAGTAYLHRIRMHGLGSEARATLVHETTHVIAMRLAGGESGQQLQRMVVFNEGLAEWVEYQVAGSASSDAQELAAAIVSKRRLVSPRQLTEYDTFAAVVDENLKYPLGAAFIEQFVRRYGQAAPKIVLQTLARDDFPRDLDGYVLWQTAFQLSGYDLDLVFDDYARRLKELETKYAREISVLPRVRGSLVKSGSAYAVALRLDLALPDGAYALVRLRPGMDSTSEQYRTSHGHSTDSGKMLAWVAPSLVTRDEVCFQPGLWYKGITVYEPWSCLPVSSASVIPKLVSK